jgi:hypothetical protein
MRARRRCPEHAEFRPSSGSMHSGRPMATAVWTVRTSRTARGAAAPRDSIVTACVATDETVEGVLRQLEGYADA